MNCKKSQKLMRLHREGELSERQAKSLKRHLEHCPDCRGALEGMSRLEETVRLGRMNAPRPGNPEILTGRIMNAIAGLQKDPSLVNLHRHSERVPVSGASEESLGRVPVRLGNPERKMKGFNRPALGWLFGRGRIRFSLAAAAFAIVGTFFIQESIILSRISRLEGRMAVISTIQAAPARLSGAFQAVEEIHGISSVTLTESAVQEEWVRIRKEDLNRLIRIVQKQYPEIRTLDEALSVDQDTMLRILRKNSGIVRQLLQSS